MVFEPLALHDTEVPAAMSQGLRIRPAELEDIESILGLHIHVFDDKFNGAFGTRHARRGADALGAAWRQQGKRSMRGMYVADQDNHVVGTITLRTWDMGLDDDWVVERALYRELGVLGALRATMAFSLLSHRVQYGEGFITDVAVDAAFRRQGIATRLLQHVEAEARGWKRRWLGLYVSQGNEGAHSLYLGQGFYDDRKRSSLMTRWIYGQRTWIYMRKDLM